PSAPLSRPAPPWQGGEVVNLPSPHEEGRREAPGSCGSQTRRDSQTSPSASGGETVWRFSSDLHCAECDIHYADPMPGRFSFNSPAGACDTCRGFGRVIGIDFGLIVPDESKTLREGAIRPWQSPSFKE